MAWVCQPFDCLAVVVAAAEAGLLFAAVADRVVHCDQAVQDA